MKRAYFSLLLALHYWIIMDIMDAGHIIDYRPVVKAYADYTQYTIIITPTKHTRQNIRLPPHGYCCTANKPSHASLYSFHTMPHSEIAIKVPYQVPPASTRDAWRCNEDSRQAITFIYRHSRHFE